MKRVDIYETEGSISKSGYWRYGIERNEKILKK